MNIGSVVGNYNSGSIMRCYAEAHETYFQLERVLKQM